MNREEFDRRFAEALEQSLPTFSPQVKARALEAAARNGTSPAGRRRRTVVFAASAVGVVLLAIAAVSCWQKPGGVGSSLISRFGRNQGLVAVVEIRHSATDATGRLLKQGDRLSAGDVVRTGAKGRVTLFTRQGSELTLNANTELTLSRTTALATLKEGEIYCRNRQKEIKCIETPAGRIRLLGTTLDVKMATPTTAMVTVLEGRVRLENTHGQVVVGPGEKAALPITAPPESPRSVNTRAAVAWYDSQDRVVSDSGKIAYVIRRDGGGGGVGFTELWVMEADGTNRHRLKTYLGTIPASSIIWVPGGRYVIVKRRGVSIPLPGEGGERKARFCGPWGTPSPPASESVIDIATGRETPFGLPPEYDSVRLLYSPSGEEIAISGVYRPAVELGSQDTCGIWLYHTATGAIRKVLDWRDAGDMAWAPDSRHLAVSVYGGGPNGPVYEGLVIVDTRSGSIRDLHITGFTPSFSPDGTKLAYCCENGRLPDGTLEHSVMVVDLGAGGKPRLAAPPAGTGRAVQPQWSPDGRLIAYMTLEHLKGDQLGVVISFYVTQADGSGVRNIYQYQGYPTPWAWSPSGDAIYAVTPKGVLLIATDGSGLRANLGGTVEDSVLSGGQRAQTEAALASLRETLNQWALGGLRAHEGRIAESQKEYRAAADGFAELMWKYPSVDLSQSEVLAYADMAAELAARPKAAVLSLECSYRLDVLAHLLLWYGAEHQCFPPDLETLQKWAISKGEDAEWCRMVFRCPAGDESGTATPYVYQAKAATGKLKLGDTIISCPNHPERNIKWDHQLFMTLGEVAVGGHDLLRKFGEVPE
jgi:hypothetical protein